MEELWRGEQALPQACLPSLAGAEPGHPPLPPLGFPWVPAGVTCNVTLSPVLFAIFPYIWSHQKEVSKHPLYTSTSHARLRCYTQRYEANVG